MRVKIKVPPGVFNDADSTLVNPQPGDEVNVGRDMGKALTEGGFAEEIKAKRAAKARTGPEETRG